MPTASWLTATRPLLVYPPRRVDGATIAATLVRDAAQAAEHEPATLGQFAARWEEQGADLIRLITPPDYELLARSFGSGLPPDPRAVAVLDRLVTLFGVNTKSSFSRHS